MRPDGQLRGVEPSLGAVTGGNYKVINGTLEKENKQSDTSELSLQEKYDKVMRVMARTGTDGDRGNWYEPLRLGDCIQYMSKNPIMKGFPVVRSLLIKRPSDSYHLPIEPTEKRRPVIEYLLSIIPEYYD